MAARDDRSGLRLSIARLGRRPGAMITFTETVPSPARMGLDLMAVVAGSPLDIDVRIQSVSEGALVTGTVTAATVGECARCLRDIEDQVSLDVTELYAYPDSVTDDTADADEVARVGVGTDADTVDLTQAVIDGLGLTLPLSPTCRPDCPGLCPHCGVVLDDAEPGHGHDVIDPRWAGLARLRDDGPR